MAIVSLDKHIYTVYGFIGIAITNDNLLYQWHSPYFLPPMVYSVSLVTYGTAIIFCHQCITVSLDEYGIAIIPFHIFNSLYSLPSMTQPLFLATNGISSVPWHFRHSCYFLPVMVFHCPLSHIEQPLFLAT